MKPSPLSTLDAQPVVVVVGATVAGAVVARCLAQAGQRVCVFDRAPEPGAGQAADAYLQQAVAAGARVFGALDVRGVQRGGTRWVVAFEAPGLGREKFEAPAMFVLCDVVVVADPAQAPLVAGLGGGIEIVVLSDAVDVPAAESTAMRLATARGWTIVAGAPISPPPAPTAGLCFTESMKGHVSTQVKDGDYARGLRLGKEEGSDFVFVLTLVGEDARVLIGDADHPARSVGTVVANRLSGHPLMVAGGDFNLFVDQPGARGDPPVRRMKYRMKMLSQEGQTFFMDGFKVIRDDPGLDVWADTTTLYTTVYDGPGPDSPMLGQGILRILPADFAHQLTTFQVTNGRSMRERVRLLVAFARVFLGTLFDTYVGAALDLPGVRRPGGPQRALAALLLRTVGIAVLAALALWPWRPALLRGQPPIVAEGLPPSPLPADVAALGLFPQYLRGLDLRPGQYQLETLRLRVTLPADALVQDHGGLAKIPFHPPDIQPLHDLPLRRGYCTLMRLRDAAGQVVGIGSQVEIASFDSQPLRHDVRTDSHWTLTLPGRGMLFLGQHEGGPDLGGLQAAAQKDGHPWRGERRINHTLGPLPEQRGIVFGGTGSLIGVVGVFREYNTFSEVPGEGDVSGSADLEIVLLTASRAPAAATNGQVIHRSLEIDLGRDILYRSQGNGVAGEIVPASLGMLPDRALAAVTVFMAKVRDERGAVVGQASASRVDAPGAAPLGQWSLTFPEGTVFVAPREDGTVAGAATGFLGSHGGRVVGGTGVYAHAMGTMREQSPDGAAVWRLFLTLAHDH